MSYIKLEIADLAGTREKIRAAFLQQDKSISEIKDSVNIHYAKPFKTRKVFAVDSGFNSAYETTFVLVKAAVVNEEMEVDRCEEIYFFHVNNYQTDHLKRLLMQQSLYEALNKTVQSGKADGSMVLVDGTITLNVFYPTLKDRREYRKHFTDFYEQLYSPLIDQCLKRNINILGFLKRSGSTYLADHLGIRGTYDINIINSLLRENGQYIGPIPVIDTNADRAKIHHKYVTFYLNLKNWNYRFDLLKEQEHTCEESIKNLLILATEAHYGMNPIFSKADEYARVTKREADLKFDYITHELDEEGRTRLRLDARKKTHFGYSSRRFLGRLL
ncbi:MAG: DNA double-strand break repair nuclease NurA [Candidatus Bathyarchaeota archaeon]